MNTNRERDLVQYIDRQDILRQILQSNSYQEVIANAASDYRAEHNIPLTEDGRRICAIVISHVVSRIVLEKGLVPSRPKDLSKLIRIELTLRQELINTARSIIRMNAYAFRPGKQELRSPPTLNYLAISPDLLRKAKEELLHPEVLPTLSATQELSEIYEIKFNCLPLLAKKILKVTNLEVPDDSDNLEFHSAIVNGYTVAATAKLYGYALEIPPPVVTKDTLLFLGRQDEDGKLNTVYVSEVLAVSLSSSEEETEKYSRIFSDVLIETVSRLRNWKRYSGVLVNNGYSPDHYYALEKFTEMFGTYPLEHIVHPDNFGSNVQTLESYINRGRHHLWEKGIIFPGGKVVPSLNNLLIFKRVVGNYFGIMHPNYKMAKKAIEAWKKYIQIQDIDKLIEPLQKRLEQVLATEEDKQKHLSENYDFTSLKQAIEKRKILAKKITVIRRRIETHQTALNAWERNNIKLNEIKSALNAAKKDPEKAEGIIKTVEQRIRIELKRTEQGISESRTRLEQPHIVHIDFWKKGVQPSIPDDLSTLRKFAKTLDNATHILNHSENRLVPPYSDLSEKELESLIMWAIESPYRKKHVNLRNALKILSGETKAEDTFHKTLGEILGSETMVFRRFIINLIKRYERASRLRNQLEGLKQDVVPIGFQKKIDSLENLSRQYALLVLPEELKPDIDKYTSQLTKAQELYLSYGVGTAGMPVPPRDQLRAYSQEIIDKKTFAMNATSENLEMFLQKLVQNAEEQNPFIDFEKAQWLPISYLMRGVYERIRVAKAWTELASLKKDFLMFSIVRSKAVSYIRLAATANHSQGLEKRIAHYQKRHSESLQKLEAEMGRLNLVVNQDVFGSKTSGLQGVETFIQSQARRTNTHGAFTEEVL